MEARFPPTYLKPANTKVEVPTPEQIRRDKQHDNTKTKTVRESKTDEEHIAVQKPKVMAVSTQNRGTELSSQQTKTSRRISTYTPKVGESRPIIGRPTSSLSVKTSSTESSSEPNRDRHPPTRIPSIINARPTKPLEVVKPNPIINRPDPKKEKYADANSDEDSSCGEDLIALPTDEKCPMIYRTREEIPTKDFYISYDELCIHGCRLPQTHIGGVSICSLGAFVYCANGIVPETTFNYDYSMTCSAYDGPTNIKPVCGPFKFRCEIQGINTDPYRFENIRSVLFLLSTNTQACRMLIRGNLEDGFVVELLTQEKIPEQTVKLVTLPFTLQRMRNAVPESYTVTIGLHQKLDDPKAYLSSHILKLWSQPTIVTDPRIEIVDALRGPITVRCHITADSNIRIAILQSGLAQIPVLIHYLNQKVPAILEVFRASIGLYTNFIIADNRFKTSFHELSRKDDELKITIEQHTLKTITSLEKYFHDDHPYKVAATITYVMTQPKYYYSADASSYEKHLHLER
jgi:hypothetical protein